LPKGFTSFATALALGLLAQTSWVPLRFNIAADPASLNPLLTLPDSGASALIVERLIFEPFVDLGASGEAVPVLLARVPTVSNGDVSDGGRRIVFRLRPGVKWHDGQPLTSRDVAFTWRAIMDDRNPVRSREGYELIAGIDARDPEKAVVSLKRPWAPAAVSLFSYAAAPQFVLPAHVFGGSTDLHEAAFNAAPIGDGPYRLVRWQRGAQIELEAFDGYWRGPAATRKLRVEIVPAPETNLAQLRAGELAFNLIAPVQQRALDGAPGLGFVSVPTSLSVGLALNTARGPLRDARLRRALAMAIDRGAISRTITFGKYPVTDSDQPRYSWAYDPAVKLPPYDPVAADRALDAAGWRRDAGGMRARGGERLELTYVQFPESTTGVRVSVVVQQMLKARGIEVNLKSISNAQLFLPAALGGVLWSGDYDLAYVPWAMGADPDDSYLLTCGGASNYMRYCNKTVDHLEEQALLDADQPTRRRLYSTIQTMVARDVPVLWLFNPSYLYAKRDSLRGFGPNPIVPTWNAWGWRAG
jgi:peptide/nickel transport system substrate-binding protein